MKKFTASAALLLSASAMVSGIAHAYDPYWEGSYRQSCTNIRIEFSELRATCRDVHGNWHEARLYDPYRCYGGIDNLNGSLSCSTIPRGSYRETCFNVATSGDTLYATCRRIDGAYVSTHLLRFTSCRSEIWNDNGQLRCNF